MTRIQPPLSTAVAAASTDGWVADTNTWTFSSVDGATGVVTINADLTGIIQAGDRIKFTQTTVKYFIVTTAPTFGGGNTTLTFWGGTDYTLANAAISATSYSHVKNPFGFNSDPTKWTIRVTDGTTRTQTSATAATWYNLGTTNSQITLHIGIWDVSYQVSPYIGRAGDVDIYTTLSTANNSETLTDMTARTYNGSAGGIIARVNCQKFITRASKAIYYLNAKTSYSGCDLNFFNADDGDMVLQAVCAYL